MILFYVISLEREGSIFFPLKVEHNQLHLTSLGLDSFLVAAGKAGIINIPPFFLLHSLFSRLHLFWFIKYFMNIFYWHVNFNNFFFALCKSISWKKKKYKLFLQRNTKENTSFCQDFFHKCAGFPSPQVVLKGV